MHFDCSHGANEIEDKIAVSRRELKVTRILMIATVVLTAIAGGRSLGFSGPLPGAQPSQPEIASCDGYYILLPDRTQLPRPVQRVRDWLIEVAR